MKKNLFTLALLFLFITNVFSETVLEGALLKGKTVDDRLFYKPGETIGFEFRLEKVDSVPEGCFISWSGNGDDGFKTNGLIEGISADGRYVVSTSLQKPGFVSVKATLLDADKKEVKTSPGKGAIRFEGGAGVEPETLAGVEEPEDFDEFWKSRKEILSSVEIKADLKEITSKNPDKYKLYQASITCAGTRPVTGFLTIPVKTSAENKYPARVGFHGYSTSPQRGSGLQWAGEWAITFDVNAHGYELGRDQEYYNEFFSDKPRYAFDIEENKNPETAYFMGMAYRVMRALEYVKSLPEWNGKDLVVTGGSQGGLQTVWAAALDHDVTRAEASIPWCCDFAGPEKFGRINGWRPKYVRGLDYFDCINMAKRIPETCYFKVPRAGLGDYTCPPSGIAILFNNVKGPKEIKWVQGSTHGYTPPQPNQEWVFTENVKE